MDIKIIVRRALNLSALTASLGMMIVLMVNMSNNALMKVIYAAVAIVLDVSRQLYIALALAEHKTNGMKTAFKYFLIYSLFLSVTLLSGLYVAYSNINESDIISSGNNSRRDSISKDITTIEKQISAEIKRMDTITNGGWRLTEAQDNIKRYRKEKTSLLKDMDAIKETKGINTTTFDKIGKIFNNMPGEWLKFYLFLAITAMLEIILITTAWELTVKKIEKIEKDKAPEPEPEPEPEQTETDAEMLKKDNDFIIKYLSFLQGTDGRINGNEKISKLAEISEARCRKYQKLLNRIIGKDGLRAMEYRQGVAQLNTTPENLKKFVLKYKAEA